MSEQLQLLKASFTIGYILLQTFILKNFLWKIFYVKVLGVEKGRLLMRANSQSLLFPPKKASEDIL